MTGSKSHLSGRISYRFDSVAKHSEFPDHSCRVALLGLFRHCRAAFFIPNAVMQIVQIKWQRRFATKPIILLCPTRGTRRRYTSIEDAPFPTRTTLDCKWSNWRSPGSQTKSVRTCQGLRPRRTVRALAVTRPFVLPSANVKASPSWMRNISRLNGWPARSPVNASPHTSRYAAHDSGPVWFAMPSP
jgi:hypothetical protein